jgi:hypothetical protein
MSHTTVSHHLIKEYIILKHIGEPFFYPGFQPPPGSVHANGQTLAREDYPELFAWAQLNALVISSVQYQSVATLQDGYCQFYSDGDGESTFRVPFYGRYLGAARNGEENTWQNDAIVNITGVGPNNSGRYLGGGSGAIRQSGTATFVSANLGSTANHHVAFDFDASRVVRTASEVRGKTTFMNIYIHACHKQVQSKICPQT